MVQKKLSEFDDAANVDIFTKFVALQGDVPQNKNVPKGTMDAYLLAIAQSVNTTSHWYSGTAVPSSGLGLNGDYYLQTSTGDVYGPKSGGVWGASIMNIDRPITIDSRIFFIVHSAKTLDSERFS